MADAFPFSFNAPFFQKLFSFFRLEFFLGPMNPAGTIAKCICRIEQIAHHKSTIVHIRRSSLVCQYENQSYGEEINQVYDENGFLVSSEQSDYGSVSQKTYEYYSDGSIYRVIHQIGDSTSVDVYQYATPEEANVLFDNSVPDDVKALTEIYDPPVEPAMPMGVIRINADNLNIRTYPTPSSPNITQNLMGVAAHAMTGEVFPVYGMVEADGYTWYKIADSIFPGTEAECQAWVANQDNWITYYSALEN